MTLESVMPASVRRFKAGESLEDFCRACKTDRMHTVVVADEDGAPLRAWSAVTAAASTTTAADRGSTLRTAAVQRRSAAGPAAGARAADRQRRSPSSATVKGLRHP